jgi:hypothetical protein
MLSRAIYICFYVILLRVTNYIIRGHYDITKLTFLTSNF